MRIEKDVQTLGQKIREYIFRKYYYFKYGIFHPIFNSRVRKFNKLEKICNSLTAKYKWIDYIQHHFHAYQSEPTYESELFGNDETEVIIKEDCDDYDYADKEDFEKDFSALIAKNKLTDCVDKEFIYAKTVDGFWREYE
jgi:hypothetical protein